MRRQVETGSLLWFTTVLILRDFQEVIGAETGANVAEYRALCRLYSIATKGQSLEDKVWLPCADGNQCGLSENLVRKLYQRLNFSEPVGVVATLDGEGIQVTNSFSTKLGRAKIQKILLAIETLRDHVEEQLNEAKQKLAKVKLEFKKAAEGDWGTEADTNVIGFPKTFATNRANDCKLTGGKGGKSLVFDVACLCTNTHATVASYAELTCGPSITQSDSNGWKTSNGDTQGKSAATKAWSALKADCGSVAGKLEVSPEFITQSLVTFDSLLGRQVGTAIAAKARSIFGKVVTGTDCGHSGDVAGAGCLDYGGSDGSKGEIEWERHLLAAVQDLQTIQKTKKRVEALQTKAKRLEEKAIAIFNETLLEAQLAGGGNNNPTKPTTDGRSVPLQSSEAQQESPLISAASSKRPKSFIFIFLVAVIARS